MCQPQPMSSLLRAHGPQTWSKVEYRGQQPLSAFSQLLGITLQLPTPRAYHSMHCVNNRLYMYDTLRPVASTNTHEARADCLGWL